MFKNGEYITSDTLTFGTMNLLHDVRNKVNTLHGEKFSLDDIDRYLKRGKVGKTDDKMEYKYDLTEPYIEAMFELLKLRYPYRHADFIMCGGGVTLFADNIIKRIPDADMIPDYLFANASGFKKIGDVIYG